MHRESGRLVGRSDAGGEAGDRECFSIDAGAALTASERDRYLQRSRSARRYGDSTSAEQECRNAFVTFSQMQDKIPYSRQQRRSSASRIRAAAWIPEA